MTAPIPLEHAQARLLDGVKPLGVETLPARDAVGRFLAGPMVAARTQPSADLSAMDGYATRADDPVGPWTVIGESAAGHPFAGELAKGEAIRISTGAHMPPGETCVLLQENVARDGDQVTLANEDGPTTRHIRRKGFDFAEGDMLLPEGTRVGAAQLALALTGGCAEMAVGKRPAVAVIDSGDELVAQPDPAKPHALPASNAAMISAMCHGLVSKAQVLGPVPDQPEALMAAFEAARDADVVVTTGGASVGDHDLIRPVLEQWGATLDFWRVAIKPGKPLLVARKGAQVVLGLPGNPVSAFVTAHLFLLPLLRKLGGAASALPRLHPAYLTQPMPAGGARREFVRGRWTEGGVAPISERDSSALRSLAVADVLIDRPRDAPPAEPGDAVRVIPLEDGGNA
ncbi:molybdopterin molybdotransferase MoeA [Tsuneonella mangrovi]|uniref:molybdopterin molybdotransferase MoeA n=1 Tax=Tsuneonella mangrovi TaxID=1982042 RepID=UPI000BA29AF4|nr:molybdopterin molybdotransferase MoeA [Tsuneonella mangrovi]